ncbi:MAG TPA: class I SAM-dependent RNA methyltransferase [Gemmatimonadaceae bacterium]|nr:class I SAM-dependent RNA methyltransferase [Gemmatimonadaceae bacterium]
MADSKKSELFAVTAPGLERITARELQGLGIRAAAEKGGVSFRGDGSALYSANLHLRTASRVVKRLAHFHASTFHELERRARKISWAEHLSAKSPVRLRVTCRKSRLYHSDAVAERLYAAIERSCGSITRVAGDDADDADEATTSSSQLFMVRIVDDECEISIDSSGDLLHRRGYRQEVAKAPLRETLAAAMILSCGWKKEQVFADPMCGSGTIPIEAAMIARNIAPGRARQFAFMRWPDFDEALWKDLHERAEGGVTRAGTSLIFGSDRDAGAIESARRNAARARVSEDVHLSVNALSASLTALTATNPEGGWVMVNPPYGVRVGDASSLRNLYATLGRAVSREPGWSLGILSADKVLARQTGIPLRSEFATTNGGIPVSFLASGGAGTPSVDRFAETRVSVRKPRKAGKRRPGQSGVTGRGESPA